MTTQPDTEKPAPVVIALGGNALADDDMGKASSKLATACQAIARVSGKGLLVTHGNGPQIGELAMGERDQSKRKLDSLGAESEGMIGYRIELELARQLPEEGDVATLLTQVEVSADDPAFSRPTKPVGPTMSREDAIKLKEKHGWEFSMSDEGCQRLVASPQPLHVVQLRAIKALLAEKINVICAGGGGVPVVRSAEGSLQGADAVVDKDHASALLATNVDARVLVLATDVDGVYRDWDSEASHKLGRVSPDDLEALSLPAGTMGAKVKAACDFVKASGKPAFIGSLSELDKLIAGRAGTQIYPAEEL